MKAFRPVALGLILVAFALRVWQLEAPSLWYDEAFCWWTTTLPWHKVLALSVREIVPPLDYWLLRGWVPLAGASEFALRLPSALIGVIAVAAAGRITRRLTGPSGLNAALLLFAIAPPLLWASREVRLYSLAQGVTLLSSLALIETLCAAPRNVRRWAGAWAVFSLAGLYTLALTGFWLIGQAIFAGLVLLRLPRREAQEKLRALGLASGLIALGFAPWLIAALRAVGVNAGYWPGFLPLSAFVRTAIQGITVGKFLPVAYGGIVLIVAALGLTFTRARAWGGLYALCYALPSLAILGQVYRTLPKWAPRHAAIFAPAPFFALAIAWGTVRLSSRRLMVPLLLGGAVIVPIVVWADLRLLSDPGHADWRSAATYIQQHRAADEVVIVETGSVFPAWLYYAGADGLLPLPQETLLNVDNVLHYENTAPQLNQALAQASGVWLISWLGTVSDPTELVATLLADAGAETPVPAFRDLTVRHFTFPSPPQFPPAPPTTTRPQAPMLPHIQLWGARMPPALPSDKPLTMWLWWRTDDPTALPDQPYHIAVRLRDALGQEWGRLDAPPANGDYRPNRWPVAAPVLGTFELHVPPGIPLGTYTLTVQLYTEGQRSPTIPVGRVRLTSPASPPPLPDGMSPVTSDISATIRLLGVGIDRPTVKPCETLSGRLFWEVVTVPQALPPAEIALTDSRATVPLLAHFNPRDWHAGDRFLTPFHLPVSCRALDSHAPLQITWPISGGVTWDGPPVHLKAERHFELPPAITPLTATLGDVAILRGYVIHARAGQPSVLTLIWQADRPTDVPYTVFVHVSTPASPTPLIAQHDSWPDLGNRPTFGWVPGEIVSDAHPLPALPAGHYILWVGMYAPDGQRLPISNASAPVEDDALMWTLSVNN